MVTIYDENGLPFSKWKPADKFAHMYREHGVGTPVRELQFDDIRKWRFDFAFPGQRVAVEINGFGFGHQAQQCQAADNEKQNAAVEAGWRVLVFNSRQLGSKQGVQDAVEQVSRVLCEA